MTSAQSDRSDSDSVNPSSLLSESPREGARNLPSAHGESRAITRFEDLPPLLTPEEAAHLLRISIDALYAKKSRGQLPGVVKIGRLLRFDRDAVVEWLRRAPSSSGARR